MGKKEILPDSSLLVHSVYEKDNPKKKYLKKYKRTPVVNYTPGFWLNLGAAVGIFVTLFSFLKDNNFIKKK